jgi:UDP-glucose 4-epimerase
MSILVTGGAGYIGSVTVELLRNRGEQVVVLDDLFRGHREAVPPDVPFYQGKIGNAALVEQIARKHNVKSCIHFAALAYVGESMQEPARYYGNNVAEGVRFVDGLMAAGVKRLVFSSTCATYGEPKQMPMSEDHPQWPANPYGWSKLLMERVLADYDRAYGLRFVALRYFNAAGATAQVGEHHEPESHLIPNVLAAAMGRRPFVSIFGSDYPTADGTAVRDYIHVVDLGAAHLLALQHLEKGRPSEFINLGNGKGYSVLEVIDAARKVTGRQIETRMEPRRAGDPSHLVADARKAHRVLGWKPAYPDLDSIVRTAWDWHQKHPQGYGQ